MKLKAYGKFALLFGMILTMIWYLLTWFAHDYLWNYFKGFPMQFFFYIIILVGIGVWIYDDRQTGMIKNRLISIEDGIRRAKITSMETEFGNQFEVTMDGLRAELSNLYLYATYSDAVQKTLNMGEEAIAELQISIENRDETRVRRNISTLRNIIGDIRSQFRR